MLLNLAQRKLVGELMDAADLDATSHHQALQGLRRINRWSRTATVVSTSIERHWRRRGHQQQMSVLDLACGGGDVTAEVSRQLRARRVPVEVCGWDRSETAIEFARRHHGSQEGLLKFEVSDALAELPEDSFDVVYCTLFLHHMSDAEAEKLLSGMYRAARQLVLIDDLRRSPVGYGLAVVACHTLSRSPIVHVDGPLSVRAAFTEAEVNELSRRCQLPAPQIVRHWPCRFLLSWDVTTL